MEVVAAVAKLEQQQRGCVRPPVGDLGEAVPRDRQVDDLAGVDVPDRRRALAAALVADREPAVARDRRPGERAHRARPSSRRSATTLPVRASRIRSEGWIRSPCSECSTQSRVSSAERARLVGARHHRLAAAEIDRLLAVREQHRGLAVLRRRRRRTRRDRWCPRPSRCRPIAKPWSQASGQPLDERLGRAAGEWSGDPHPRLVARGVAMPDDPFAVRRDLARRSARPARS